MKKYSKTENATSILNEPEVAYGSANFYQMACNDISKNYVKRILDITKFTVEELIAFLPMSIDTYKRKNEFGSNVTEKVLEIEEVYREGNEAFGEGFHDWMNIKNVALGGIIPKSLLSNSFGVRRLLDQIGRIKHGILA